ncbi:peptidase, M48 domain protein [Bacteriovorax sp. BSW11_IV]|uniref:M48 family metalloprotease n=1 Tax=Bacteriovorax sp. BSW11_IV TaxID=1353529 RepID=UPI00038A40C0|nr:M48 family metalloprotease [Bacteriovorax sp. BSW11_IV]EQC49417.1 peptidase, M48 domain protein [Bacteriovorax sp. BSW11_IV]
MRKMIMMTILASLLGTPAFACDMDGKTGIVEKNDLYIPVGEKSNGGITEAEFNEIIEKVEGIYAPIIEAKGKTLQIVRNWTDGTVNAYARQIGNTWEVQMFGGLARHETITRDGFATVVCHEIGHHLGGAPKKASWWGSSWASNEGQADYFGTSKCLRKFMEKDNNEEIVANLEVPAFATEKCAANFKDAADLAMCQRGAMAGMSLANLFRALRNMSSELKFETPDSKVVSKTDDNHPAPQCRLDTYFQGALCDQDHYSDVDESDATIGTCNRSQDYVDGVRPLCWYKPARI